MKMDKEGLQQFGEGRLLSLGHSTSLDERGTQGNLDRARAKANVTDVDGGFSRESTVTAEASNPISARIIKVNGSCQQLPESTYSAER